MSPQKARYIADKLTNMGYLNDLLVMGQPTRYGLSKKGRAFLIEEGHIKCASDRLTPQSSGPLARGR